MSVQPLRTARLLGVGAVAAIVFVCGLPACEKKLSPEAPLPADAPPPPTTPTVPPTTAPPIGPNAPVLSVKTVPSPASGNAPFDVNFNACKSYDPDGDRLTFTFTFGDGQGRSLQLCRHDHTYRASGSYAASVCVTDRLPGNERCRAFTVTVF